MTAFVEKQNGQKVYPESFGALVVKSAASLNLYFFVKSLLSSAQSSTLQNNGSRGTIFVELEIEFLFENGYRNPETNSSHLQIWASPSIFQVRAVSFREGNRGPRCLENTTQRLDLGWLVKYYHRSKGKDPLNHPFSGFFRLQTCCEEFQGGVFHVKAQKMSEWTKMKVGQSLVILKFNKNPHSPLG